MSGVPQNLVPGAKYPGVLQVIRTQHFCQCL